MGAEVIKIEEIEGGDPGRYAPQILGVPNRSPEGLSYFFEMYNHGKKSLALDLKKEKGKEILYKLVEKSDVFITNFRRPAAARLGLDYETLKKYNPRLIYASSTAYGRHGPDGNLPGVDFAASNRAGITRGMLPPQEPPRIIVGLADETGGIAIAFGVLAALYAREKQGIGQEFHTSLLASGMWVQSTMLGLTLMAGQEVPPWDRHNVDPMYNYYRAGDGKWFTICAGVNAQFSQRYWPHFCRAIGRPDLLEDARFETVEMRLACAQELIELLDEIFATKPRDEWLRRLREADLPVAPVNSHTELINDVQVKANNYIVEFRHPVGRTLRHLNFPVEFTRTPADVCKPAPRLGEHNEEVLTGILGYTPAQVEELRREGVIGPNHA